jgi:hypothetical protein
MGERKVSIGTCPHPIACFLARSTIHVSTICHIHNDFGVLLCVFANSTRCDRGRITGLFIPIIVHACLWDSWKKARFEAEFNGFLVGRVPQVLNKYYPPDFDPLLLPRNKKPSEFETT